MKWEKDIISRSLKGDSKAQRALVDFYGPSLLTVCRRYAHLGQEPRDILQEAFILIFQNLGKIDFKKGRPINYMIRICINVALSQRLRISKRAEIETSVRHYQSYSTRIPEVYSQLHVETLMEHISSIPKIYSDVFNLYVIEGYSHNEISKTLSIGESTSRTYLSRARQLLKEKIIQYDKSKFTNRSF